ncbi:MAG: ABC transporter ATP-binding protein [Chloroflexota bacterium]
MSSTGLSLINLYKSFGETRALQGVSFEVARGEIVSVLGPSGCGKSTLLAVIAGLEQPDEGEVLWDGKPLYGIPPYQRGFGLMFQDYVLFPHMNVFANIAFGLRMAGLPPEGIQLRVSEILNLVGLSEFEKRDIETLSGGEQQRVALARSLAPNPKLLMLDEPLGSLDRTLRERLLLEIRTILQKMHQTALYVTHDQEEAFAVADRVVVMRAGQVVQIGTPQSIYQHPSSIFVARFLGLNNILEGEAIQIGDRHVIRTPIGEWPVSQAIEGQVPVLIRPDIVQLGGGGKYQLEGQVMERSFRGGMCRVTVNIRGEQLTFDFPSGREPIPSPGEPICLGFDPQEGVQLFP